MSGRTRGWRRAQLARKKRRVAHYYGGYARGDAAAIGKLASTPTPCSHPWCCGNRRRIYGELTIQERRVAHPDANA